MDAATTCELQTMPDGTVTFDKFVYTKHERDMGHGCGGLYSTGCAGVDEQMLLNRVMSDYLLVLVAYLNRAPAVKVIFSQKILVL